MAYLQNNNYSDPDKDSNNLKGYSGIYNNSPSDFFKRTHVAAKDDYVSCLLKVGGPGQCAAALKAVEAYDAKAYGLEKLRDEQGGMDGAKSYALYRLGRYEEALEAAGGGGNP